MLPAEFKLIKCSSCLTEGHSVQQSGHAGGLQVLIPDSWPIRCSAGGMQKLLGESFPHLCSERRAAGLRVPLHHVILYNVGQWPLQTFWFVRPYKGTGRGSAHGLRR